ncbi:hypothetical protein MASR2M15_10420 [Anaerolineales bacterium]
MLKKFPVLIISLILVAVFSSILAQDDSCNALVEQAFAAIGDDCANMDRNTACYGYYRVDASFQDVEASDYFTTPADRGELSILQTIKTAPLSTANGEWGVAVMSVQANMPNTLPDQLITFVMLGDVELKNEVTSGDEFVPAEPLEVNAITNARLRSGPGENWNVVAGAVTDETLLADALSEDLQWLRITKDEHVAWIFRDLVTSAADLDALPVYTSTDFTPMQAFHLKTGLGSVSCEEAPESALLIQGPDNFKVTIQANGANIELGSTILIRLNEGGQMELIVIDGEVHVGPPDTVITTGQKAVINLVEDEEGNLIVDGDWSEPEYIGELEKGAFCALDGLPTSLFNYPVNVLCPGEFTDAELFAQNASLAPRSTTKSVCANFKPTSPLGGAQIGLTTFYWDAATDASAYELRLFDYTGTLAGTFQTGPVTNLTLNTGCIPLGGTYTWEVTAIKDGAFICTSSRTGSVTNYAAPTAIPPTLMPPTPEPTIDYGATEECCYYEE